MKTAVPTRQKLLFRAPASRVAQQLPAAGRASRAQDQVTFLKERAVRAGLATSTGASQGRVVGERAATTGNWSALLPAAPAGAAETWPFPACLPLAHVAGPAVINDW